jgi:AraC-like DNA-binding protein
MPQTEHILIDGDHLPRIILAGRFKGIKLKGYSANHHWFHCYNYSSTFRINGKAQCVKPGDITLIPKGASAEWGLPTPGNHWCIHFDLPIGQSGIALPQLFSLKTRQQQIKETMAQISRLHQRGANDRVAGMQASALLYQLLLEIAHWHTETGTESSAERSHPAIPRLKLIIQERLREPLAIPELAREVRLSQNYLARLFRQQTGMTIQHYLLLQRIQRARELLVQSSMPIKTIAHEVGLRNPQHFYKQFRAMTGMKPSALRNEHITHDLTI